MEIRFVKGGDIDKTKWNSCIHFSNLGNIFGYHWYLTNVIKEWDALVEGDYESVLPLIKSEGSFFSKAKLYTHPLLRSTGIYSVHVLSEKRIRSFLDAIPKEYKRWQIKTNEGIKLPNGYKVKLHTEKKNGLLLLKEPYEQINEAYEPVLLQRLERASLAQLYSINNLKPERLADLYRSHHPEWQEVHYHTYLRIMYNALHRGWGMLSGVQDQQGTLCAANFFIFSHGRFMSLLPVVTPKGKQEGALEFLYDWNIRIQAKKPLLFDFNVEEIGDFEKQFGVTESPFLLIGK